MSTLTSTTVEEKGVSTGARVGIGKAASRLSSAGLLLFLVLVGVAFSMLTPYFLSVNNFVNILLSVALIGMVATGMTLVLVGGGLDLSVGSTIGLAGCIEGVLMVQGGIPWYIGIAAGLATGLVVGILNAAAISYLRINPIITTLATMSIVRGAAYIYTEGNSIYVASPQAQWLGTGRLLGAPVPVIIMAVCFVSVWAVSRYTVFGRYIYAIGGNPVASRLAGIRVNRYLNVVFVFSGLVSGLAGVVMVGLTASAVPAAGTGYELDVITAVLLGGTSLSGGEGSVWGTLVGVLIIGVINNGMTLLNVPPYWQIAAKGALLLAAVSLDALRKRTRANV